MSLRLLTAGESHGPALTAILDGMPSGLALESAMIDRDLVRRQNGFGSGGRMKIEKDRIKILGGVMAGLTTGAPLALLVENADHAKWQGKEVEPMTAPRPGHADLTGALKYGYKDLRPALERSSARETTMRVAAGAVCKHFLAQFGILVGGYVRAIGEIGIQVDDMPFEARYKAAEQNDLRCPDENAVEKMRERIKEVITAGDTIGGIIEIFTLNIPVGLGSHVQWDRRLDARLVGALMSVQSVKGVEIGTAFENTRLPGTQVHDAIKLDGESLTRTTNRAGGIEGGISNGQPIILQAALKPIATTLTPQQTVDLAQGKEAPTKYERSDFCQVPRGVPVLETMAAFVVADALIEKLGGDSLDEMLPRFESLKQACLKDLPMDHHPHEWWE